MVRRKWDWRRYRSVTDGRRARGERQRAGETMRVEGKRSGRVGDNWKIYLLLMEIKIGKNNNNSKNRCNTQNIAASHSSASPWTSSVACTCNFFISGGLRNC